MTTKFVLASRIAFVAAVAGLLLASGCGEADKSCPISGQVLVNDRPANGVYVVFHPAGGARAQQGSARTNAEGTFSFRVREPGEYTVTVFWPRVTFEAGESIEGEDRFAGRHRDPLRPVLTVTIREGDNPLPPIKLTSP